MKPVNIPNHEKRLVVHREEQALMDVLWWEPAATMHLRRLLTQRLGYEITKLHLVWLCDRLLDSGVITKVSRGHGWLYALTKAPQKRPGKTPSG